MESHAHQQSIVSQFTQQSRPFAEIEEHSADRSFEVFRELGSFSGTERVLDSGCGPGLVSRYLAPLAAEVIGLDLTPAMVELASKAALQASLSNLSFLEGNMTELPFSTAQFDRTVTRYTFHHLEDPEAAFREMIRVTRPNGKIIVVDVTPEESKRDAYDQFERLRDPSHTSAFTFSELSNLGQIHGLSNPEIIRFGLEMNVEKLIQASFPESISREQLIRLLIEDIGKDHLSFQIRKTVDSFIMTFPVTAAAWQMPSLANLNLEINSIRN